MTLATDLPEVVVMVETATVMTAAVEDMVDVIMIVAMEEDDETIVIADTAETVTITLLATSTDTPVMIDTAEVAMTDVEVVADTLIAMSVATAAQLVKPHHQPPPMVIQLPVESPGNHTEVEASMKIDSPVVNIDC